MQNFRKKTAFTTLLIVILAASSITMLSIPAQAQTQLPASVTNPTNLQEGGSIPGPLASGTTAEVTIKTHAFLSFRPNPVGQSQTVLVNLWLNPATHASRYLSDYKVTITKPDGSTEVVMKDSYKADTTAWFEFVPDQVGNWKLKFEFPGGYFPAGNYTADPGAVMGSGFFSFPGSCYYEPSSTAEQTLVVTDTMVLPWPESSLPTDYWTRPARLENREWWPILGNYPGTGYQGGGTVWDQLYPDTNPAWSSSYNFHPWIQGPNTGHIVWKRQGALAGLIGGPAGQLGMTGSPGTVNVIYAGRAYDSYVKPGTNGTTYWRCTDLRTGEVCFEQPAATTTTSFFGMIMTSALTPNILAYTTGGMLEVPGAAAGETYSVELIALSGGRLYKWNPYTGALTLNTSISPLTSGTFYNQYEGYVLSVQNIGNMTNPNYRLINWTTKGSSTNFASRILSNTSYASSSLPSLIDWQAGYGATVSAVTPPQVGAWVGTNVVGYNLYTGQLLWNKTVEDTCYSMTVSAADHGKVATLMMGGYFMAWDLATGNLAWKGEAMDYPWSEPAFGAYAIQSAYGMIFREAYDGVYAFDWDDGSIVWHYVDYALSMYESPYTDKNGTTVYSINTGATVVDGKLYTYNTEHTESWPLTRGWGLLCINATTGELIWRIANPMSVGGIADGYLAASDSRDGYQYVFGKGKTATTLTSPDMIISKGNGIVIKGTVLDMSPAQPGTPCVSAGSMSTQMEYLHLAYPIGGIWGNQTIEGVPVTLTAIDPNGNTVEIGEVTTNGYYGTFSIDWTPDMEGTYQIIASFGGDDSYGSSSASTSIVVGAAAPTSSSQQQEVTVPDYTMTIVAMGIAVMVVVAIVGVLLYRKP
ncbi:MAG: PQQ-binding-like beta-propeller repeat protein [Candidatus Bathyarchaeia archaeon]|jgi:hypothetical protein